MKEIGGQEAAVKLKNNPKAGPGEEYQSPGMKHAHKGVYCLATRSRLNHVEDRDAVLHKCSDSS